MKKKFLISAVAASVALSAMGALVACGDDTEKDAELAQQVIATVRTMYADKSAETPVDYDVMGQIKVDETFYTINWSVSSDVADYGNYVVVGDMNDTTKMVTVSITKAEVEVAYTLTASVTVGAVTETASFARKIPAGVAVGEDKISATLSFADKQQRTVFSTASPAQQVWTQNDVTLTNTGNVGDYANPVRLYKSTTTKIEYSGKDITHVVFDCAANYVNVLKTSLEAENLGTITVDGDKLTLELTYPTAAVEFTASAQIRVASIEVVAYKNPISDDQRIAGVKAGLNIQLKKYWITGEYDLPSTLNSTTITWGVEENTNVEITAEGKLKIKGIPDADAPINLTATITSNDASDTKGFTITLVQLGLTGAGTLENPYTSLDAKKIAATFDAGFTYSEEVHVQGYVIEPGTYSTSYSNFENMYIANDKDHESTAEDALYVFGPKPDGTHLTTDGFLKGDRVIFKGKLQNYKESEETLVQELTGGTCVRREIAQRSDAEIVAGAKANVDLAKKSYSKANEEVTLPTGYQGATYEWAVTTQTNLVEITAAGKLKIKEIPGATTPITLTVTISSNDVQDTKTIDISVGPLQLDHAGTLADPYSLADVKKIEGDLDERGYYKDGQQFYVTGYVVKVGTWSEQYHNYTGCYLIDEYAADKDENSAGAIQLYRLAQDGEYITGATSLNKGDRITVVGYIQKYNNKVQITYSGSTNPTVVDMDTAGDTRTAAEKVAAAKQAVTLATSYEAGDVTLPTKNNGATLEWAVTSGSANARIEGNIMTLTATDTDAPVTVMLTIICNDSRDTKLINFIVLAPIVEGTEEHPYTVAQINAIFDDESIFEKNEDGTLKNGTYKVGGVDKLVYVEGYVVAVGADGDYGRQNVKIADTAGADENTGMLIYGHNYDANLPKGFGLQLGDKVLVSGYLKVYNNTKEIANVDPIRPVIKVELTDAQRAERTLGTVSNTLSNISATGDTTLPIDVTLPTSKVEGVALTWAIANANGVNATVVKEGDDYKLRIAALPDENKTVTLTVTVGDASLNQTKEVTVVVEAPSSDNVLTLDCDSITNLTGGGATSYASYNGTRTVNGYELTTSNVMSNKPSGYSEKTIQMKGNTNDGGTMSLTGDFTKIVIVFISTYDYGESFNNVVVTAGSSTLEVTYKGTVETEDKDSNNRAYKKHTFEYTVTGGSQVITISKPSSGAAYLESVVFTLAEDEDSTPENN